MAPAGACLGQQLEQQQLCRTGRQKLVIARDKNKRLALQALGRGNRFEISRHKGRLEPGDFVGLDRGAGPDLALGDACETGSRRLRWRPAPFDHQDISIGE